MAIKEFKREPKQGYVLNFAPSTETVRHEFCGAHAIPGAQCPYCEKPLVRLLSLRASDGRLGVDPLKTPVVHLFYCWTCSIPFGEFSYKVLTNGAIELLQIPERVQSEFGPDGPYEGYRGEFPMHEIALEPLDPSEAAAIATWYEGNEDDDNSDDLEPRHQVGGIPFIYNPSEMSCPMCHGEMPFLATICNDAAGNDPFRAGEEHTFAGNGGVQMVFHFCRECAIVSAYHSVD